MESEIASSQFSTGYFLNTSLGSDTKVTKSLFWGKRENKMEILRSWLRENINVLSWLVWAVFSLCS